MRTSSAQWASLFVPGHHFLTEPDFTASWLHALSASLVPARRHKGWTEQYAPLASTGRCVGGPLLAS